ncbi:MAG: trigger factor [Ichthyobacteriaceae bacterium]|nr:trigger factor [Ichthyobacteriaceae bacterium]
MQVTRENSDALNAVLNVQIVADDYKAQMDKILNGYRKKSNIPGFRKGLVPMGLIKKQYGRGVLIEEVNKVLQGAVNQYIKDEKIEILGNPLPMVQDDINWNGTEFNFKFELGLTPEFNVELDKLEGIKAYKVVIDDELINKQIEDFTTRFGKVISKEEVAEDCNVSATIVELNEDGSLKEEGISNSTVLSIAELKGKRNPNKFMGKKVGDVVKVKTKSLFEEETKLANLLGLKVEEVKDLDIELQITIVEVNFVEKHEINQELFDKIYGEGAIDSEEAFRARIKEEAGKVYIGETDRYFLNQVTDKIVDATVMELPKEFLIKWLKSSSETPKTDEEAVLEYEKSEKGIKYQLIEGRIFADNKIQLTFEEIKASAIELIKVQMAQYGQANMEDKDAEDIAMRVLQNKEEYQRITEQVKMEKLSAVYKEKVNAEVEELSFDEFVAAISK